MSDLRSHLDRIGMTSADLARKLSVHPSQVTRWIKWGMPIPERHVDLVSSITGVPADALRPARKTEAA